MVSSFLRDLFDFTATSSADCRRENIVGYEDAFRREH
jgi:hypothetical protein